MSARKTIQRQPIRLVRRLVLGALTLVVAATVSIAAPHVGVFASSAQHTARHCGPSPRQDVGLPEIKPSLPCQVPAFTSADVMTFYGVRNINGVNVETARLAPGTTVLPQLVSIQFLPASQVDAILGDQFNVPSDYLLCLVWSSGHFTLQGAEVPSFAHPNNGTFLTRAYAVFDATTGNLLEFGAAP